MFNEKDLTHDLLLTTRQKAKLRNAFNNNVSTKLKLPKAQISKIIQSGGFLGRLFAPLLKTGLPLINNVIKPLTKSVLIPLGLTAAAAAAVDAGIHKKNIGIWSSSTLRFANNNFDNFRWRNEWYNENCSSTGRF